MCIQIAQHSKRQFHTENKGKNAVSFLHRKIMFFHDVNSQNKNNFQNFNLFEDLNFLKPTYSWRTKSFQNQAIDRSRCSYVFYKKNVFLKILQNS